MSCLDLFWAKIPDGIKVYRCSAEKHDCPEVAAIEANILVDKIVNSVQKGSLEISYQMFSFCRGGGVDFCGFSLYVLLCVSFFSAKPTPPSPPSVCAGAGRCEEGIHKNGGQILPAAETGRAAQDGHGG